jgi:uncharacterized oligopeptide transporter (OPT) family protein
VGIAAIAIDRLFLAPRNPRFRLYPMPLAVGMYLPWTVTVPILFGGAAFLLVERRSKARGLSSEESEAAVHRGLLFSSGLVAGEAILGIAIAFLLVSGAPIPLLDWDELGGGWPKSLLSLAGFLFVTWLLVHRSFAKPASHSK